MFFDYRVTQDYIENIVKRIKQPLPKAPSTRIGTIYEKGLNAIGIGSRMTRVQEDQAAARLELINWVNDPRNQLHFRGLSPSQQEGIRSLLSGEK